MMDNFLLKIHMQKEQLTELYLNKERKAFKFVDEKCVSDLIVPDFKITSLNLILKNISSAEGDENCYAEYELDGNLVREYDEEKINLIMDMVSKLSLNDFLDYVDECDTNINNFYIDSIIDRYNCTLLTETKRILSYTTNGVVLEDGKDSFNLMAHEDIINYNGALIEKRVVPFMRRNNESYIGYDLVEQDYEEYVNDEKIKEGINLRVLLNKLEKEDIIDEVDTVLEEAAVAEAGIAETVEESVPGTSNVNEDAVMSLGEEAKENVVLDEETMTDIEEAVEEQVEKIEQEELEEKEQEQINNIDEQFKRLNAGVIKNEKKVPDFIQEHQQEKEKSFEDAIRLSIIEALEKMEEKETSKVLITDTNVEQVKVDEETNVKIEEFTIELTEEEQDEIMKNVADENFREFLIEYTKEIDDQDDKDFIELLIKYGETKTNTKESIKFIEFLKNEDRKFSISKEEKKFQELLKKYKSIKEEQEHQRKKLIDKDMVKNEELISKLLIAQEKPKKKEMTLNDIVLGSLNNASNNYLINFNDTQKLVVEHLPYYELGNQFDVIQIPEIELDKLTMVPNEVIDLGKISFVVYKLTNDSVDLLVQSASTIVDSENKKIKKGDHIQLNLKNEVSFRINRKGVMETWTLKMEKSTFVKELRNIEYAKLLNKIEANTDIKSLGNIEKHELKKCLMLFIDIVMNKEDEKVLEELTNIIEKEPLLYEEYITDYLIKYALENTENLQSYDSKKAFKIKYNYVKGLIDAKWLDYPRYIFRGFSFFDQDEFLQDYIVDIEETLKDTDFKDYLKAMFKKSKMFENLDEEGKENLDKCLEYISILYKYHPGLGEDYKYKIERLFMIGADEEDMSLLISKLCRRGIKDYSAFMEYDLYMKERYRSGELQYPMYSEYFGLEGIRNGGDENEF